MTSKIIFTALFSALLLAGPAPASADFYDGLRAYDEGDHAGAVREWTAAARAGDVKAMFRLGQLNEQGMGVVQNFVRGHAYYNLAASKGLAEARAARDGLAAKMTADEQAEARRLAAKWSDTAAIGASPPASQAPVQMEDTSLARFDGLWKWDLVEEESECSLAFGPPAMVKDGRYTGVVTSILDMGVRSVNGKIDHMGKVNGFVGGNYVSVVITGQLNGDTGEGRADVSGEMVCTEYWTAKRVSKN